MLHYAYQFFFLPSYNKKYALSVKSKEPETNQSKKKPFLCIYYHYSMLYLPKIGSPRWNQVEDYTDYIHRKANKMKEINIHIHNVANSNGTYKLKNKKRKFHFNPF
jgi:hypothetical protein